jgi:hypothetical protein
MKKWINKLKKNTEKTKDKGTIFAAFNCVF